MSLFATRANNPLSTTQSGHRMPHEDLADNEVEIKIDKNGQVSVRGNNLDNMEEIRGMLAEIGIYLEDSEAQ